MGPLLSKRQGTEIAVAAVVLLAIVSSVGIVHSSLFALPLFFATALLALIATAYFVLTGESVLGPPLQLGGAFLLLCGLGVFIWRPGVDWRDPLGILLFFVVLPSAVYVGFSDRVVSQSATWKALFAVLLLTVAVSVADLIAHGLAPTRGRFYGANKNTVALFFELIYVYLLYTTHSRVGQGVVVGGGAVALAAIFSKAAIIICALFTAGRFSKRLFWALGVATAIAALPLIRGILDVQMLQTAGYRLLLWAEAGADVTRSVSAFLLGNGPGTFESGINRFGLGGLSIHNYFLNVLYSYGFIALGLLAWYFGWIWRRCGLLESGAIAAFWAFNLHGLIDVGWVLGPGFLASYLLGIALRGSDKDPIESAARRPMEKA